MVDLHGRRVFVAGGSRGIGRAAGIMAATCGADVAVGYNHDSDAAQATVTQIQGLGRKALAVQADITNLDQLVAAADRASAHLGGLDSLVVSAGIFEGAAIDSMSLEFWNRTMAVNLTGTFLATKAILPHLRKANGGSIVIYTSTAGQRGSDIYSAYATSKGGQIMFMRSMAKELAKDRIRVNCVAPGWTESDMSRPELDRIGRATVIDGVPLGRIGQPQDVAGATIYLLSDLAQFVTGMTLTVDGGQDMRG